MTENEFNSGIEKVDGMNGWFGGERGDYGIAFKDQNPSLSVALGIGFIRPKKTEGPTRRIHSCAPTYRQVCEDGV
jgi:hypothetical protein